MVESHAPEPPCPITGAATQRWVQWLSKGMLVDLWRYSLRVDVSDQVSDIERFGIWESPTGLLYFRSAARRRRGLLSTLRRTDWRACPFGGTTNPAQRVRTRGKSRRPGRQGARCRLRRRGLPALPFQLRVPRTRPQLRRAATRYPRRDD